MTTRDTDQDSTAAGQTIVRNSIWYGLETIIESLVYFVTSIAVARALGPEKLGFVVFLNFLTSFATRVGGIGISNAVRKYMAECFSLDKPGVARAIYQRTLHVQIAISLLVLLGGVVLSRLLCAPEHRLYAYLMIGSTFPALINFIPAQANAAWGDLSRNVPATLSNSLIYASIISLTLYFHWDISGLAAAFLFGRSAEMIVRLIPVQRRIHQLPIEPLPAEIASRLKIFVGQSVALMLVAVIVADRSEVFFLRGFAPWKELAFYSVAFSLAEKLLLLPRIFAAGAGLSLIVESSRNRELMNKIFAGSAQYLCFLVFPVHIGVAALALPLIRLFYGPAYVPAVPAVVVSLILMMPRAFQFLPETLFQATDRQSFLVRWTLLSAGVNLALDLLLIPYGGALGAATANGLAQMFAVVGPWLRAARENEIAVPYRKMAGILACAMVMGMVVAAISALLPSGVAVVGGILVGALIYGVAVRLSGSILLSEAVALTNLLGTEVPSVLRKHVGKAIFWLASADPEDL